MASISVQDYLQTIYRLQSSQSPVSTTALAGQLGIAPPSVSGMIQKLHAEGLVEHVPYRGVVLTEAGEHQALLILRRHRLWERFLTDVLGLSWDQVHQEADRLEHATSERIADRLEEIMNHPTTDPHGQQIPARNGTLPSRAHSRLVDVDSGHSVTVVEVPDDDPEILRHLGRLGLFPGAEVTVWGEATPDGMLKVRIGDIDHTVGLELAAKLLVTCLVTAKE